MHRHTLPLALLARTGMIPNNSANRLQLRIGSDDDVFSFVSTWQRRGS